MDRKWMAPNVEDVCNICGKTIEWNEKHGVWPAYPQQAHTMCIPWEEHEFPKVLREELAQYRQWARLLASAWNDLVAAGRELAELERNWPPQDTMAARRTVENGSDRIRRIEAKIERLKERLK